MPVKRSTRAKAPQTAKHSPAPVISAPAAPTRIDASTDSSRMMGAGAVLLVFCVMAAAMLLAARESSSPAPAAGVEATADAVVPQPDVDRTSPTPSVRVSTSARTAAAKSPAKSAFVTITGCLERGDDSFRLTDTDGSEAPRSRNWKSGFLKKSPAAVDVVDQANRVKLATHVGQRVSVTGTLEDRQMQVRSLRRIAPACN